MPKGNWRRSCLEACNGEHDLDHDDDDQHVHIWHPNNPPHLPPSTDQPRLITFKQPKVWEMVSYCHQRYVSLSFMQSVVLNLSDMWMKIFG
jgi:hypothetical protein